MVKQRELFKISALVLIILISVVCNSCAQATEEETLRKGVDLTRHDKFDEAIAEFNKIITDNPKSANAVDKDNEQKHGADVKRMEAQGIKVTEKDGAIEINTGAAIFTVSKNNLLVETAVLLEPRMISKLGPREIPLWSKGGNYAYLIDNQGRMAKCAGAKAEIELSTLKSGPMRYVIRTEGWYVTDQGERVARGIARMSFFAGSAMVELSHTLVFTEDTNKIWVRDYGIEAPVPGGAHSLATFDVSKAFDEIVKTVELKRGESVGMLQGDFPHFAETNSHFSLARN